MTDTKKPYNRRAIYELLLAAFTPQELRRFCRHYDDFEPLLARFGDKYSLAEMADEVLAYCQRHGLWESLLDGLKEHNAYQYGLFEDRLHDPEASEALHVHAPISHAIPSASFRKPSNYLDFELEIGPGQGRDYPVVVLRSPAGEARATMHFPFDELALENRLLTLQNVLLRSGGKHRRMPTKEEQAVQDFGQALFDALFSGEIRSYYDMSLREAMRQDRGLRLKVRIRPPELSALPWEFMYDPRQAEYVCLSRRTPIVRYLESPLPIRPLSVRPPLRILGMIASPDDLPSLDIEREKQRVEQAVQGLQVRGLVELAWLPGQTWRDLQEAMWGGPWHIFHFIGHGGLDANTDEGFIALADGIGKTHCLSATHLGRFLADHNHLRLVLLNSCEGARGGDRDVFSSTASILVQRGIPAVLAMQYEITDRAAVELARAFYRALAHGMAVDEALAAARKAISVSVANTVEWGTPVLYMRAPDGVLFHMAPTPHPARPEPQSSKSPARVDEALEAQLAQLYFDGLAALGVEDQAEARRCFLSIVEKRPDYRDAAARLETMERQQELAEWERRATPEDLYHRAVLAVDAGEWSEAYRLLARVQTLEPGYRQVERLLAHAADKAAPSPGEVRVFAGVEMVYVPAGPFTMGSEGYKDEKPPHKVRVSGFWIDRTPVINKEYRRFVEATGYDPPQHWRGNRIPKNKEDHPVVNVNWHDAQAYCRWRSQESGVEIRLPTEAEWEKAARAIDGRLYPWGDRAPDDNLCNFDRKVGDTTPVGRYSPYGDSPYGLVDMAGNVWEWTGSLYKPYPYDAADGREDPEAGGNRVPRGGGWSYSWGFVRAANRSCNDPADRHSDLGFRCVGVSPGG